MDPDGGCAPYTTSAPFTWLVILFAAAGVGAAVYAFFPWSLIALVVPVLVVLGFYLGIAYVAERIFR